MSNNTPITLTQAQLDQVVAAAVAAALSQVTSVAQAQATTPAPAPAEAPAPAPAPAKGWTNVVGYACKAQFTAGTSSKAIARHLRGSCGCKKSGSQCHWAQSGRLSAKSFGSRPDILGVEADEDNNTYVFVGEGGKVITDVVLS